MEICNKQKLRTLRNMLKNITISVLHQTDNCSVPCQITFLTLNNLLSPKHDKARRTFTFKINPVATLTKAELIYTLWDYIAEFGGWAGLFIGFSIIDLFDSIKESLFRVSEVINL